jgi:predicted dehydrogenase/type 1 glutamine amidotransferase
MSTPSKKLAILTGGLFHPWESCGAILRVLLEQNHFVIGEMTEDRDLFTRLDGYDAVVIYANYREDLTAEQEKGLLEFVRAGGGLVGIHSATVCFRGTAGYMDLIGTEFAGHGPMSLLPITAADNADELVQRVPGPFKCFDEFYRLEVRTDAELRVFHEGAWQAEKQMMGYTRDYGAGKVFYTALGHDERAFRNPDFQDTVVRGAAWATGQMDRPNMRFGLVGFGPAYSMGQHHAGNINGTAGLEVTAVCDVDPARLEAACEALGADIATFTDLREMAASGLVDVGVVILPHSMHADAACALLERGVGVVTEKPFAVTVQECDRMITLAAEKDLLLSVYHSRHWDADMWTIRQVVEAGTIGELFSIEHNMGGYGQPGQAWRSHKPLSGGIIYDMGAHGFEKIFQLVPRTNAQAEPVNRTATVFGHSLKKVWHDVTNEDYVRAYVKFDTGLEAQIVQSNISAVSKPQWLVQGTRGAIVTTPDGLEVTTVDDHANKRTVHVPLVEGLDWRSYYVNVADHLQFGAPLVIPPQLAKATIQCIRAAEQAANTNQTVPVAFDF